MRKILLVLIAMFSLALVTGCSCQTKKIDKEFEDLTEVVKAGEQDGVAIEKVQITVNVTSGIVSDSLTPLVPEFEAEYPHVGVTLNTISGGYPELRKTNILQLQSNQAPTITLGYPDHFAEYYSASAMINLSNFIKGPNGYTEEELADFIPSYLAEGAGFDDENPNDYYSLPFNKSTEVLVYNKTILDKAIELDPTISVPKTWAEVKSVSEKLLALGSQGKLDGIIQVATGELEISEHINAGTFYTFAYDSSANAFITFTRQVKSTYTERANNEQGYLVFDTPENVANLTYFQNENTAKRFAVAETFGSNYASDAFKRGQVLFTVGSSAGIKYNEPEGNKFQIGISTVPYFTEDAKFVIQQGTNIAMLAQSTNLERAAAWLFIKYLLRPENTAKFAMASGGYLPVRASAYETADYQEYLTNPPLEKRSFSKAANLALQYREQGYQFFVDPAFVGSSKVRDEVGSALVSIVVNKHDVKTRLEAAYATLGKAYQK